jgi:phosphatidylinositol 4-kinase
MTNTNYAFYASFTRLNHPMTNTISRFLATPSPVFDLQTERLKESVSVQQYAIIRLAQCIKVKTQNKNKQTSTC